MISTAEAQNLLTRDGNVVGTDGDKVGSIGQVFLDDETGTPAWVTVKTGMFGQAESFVPLEQATLTGDDVTVPYTKDKVKDAPRVSDSDGHLTPAEETELYAYYELGHGTAHVESTDHTNGTVGHDTSGPTTDSAMTRSEEQLHVGTTTETTGKARLRKYIVTENVTTTVPVSHEEVRVVSEPITDANRGEALSGGDLTEEEHEVELTAERVVVDKETVPVERVRLETDTVTEEQQVDETVRKEQIESDAGRTTSYDDTARGEDQDQRR